MITALKRLGRTLRPPQSRSIWESTTSNRFARARRLGPSTVAIPIPRDRSLARRSLTGSRGCPPFAPNPAHRPDRRRTASLEVNFGGDHNPAHLAAGVGVLDGTYREHLRACGYRI